MPNILIYLLIVVVKTIEVALATLRIKLITKGQQVEGSLVGFVEIIIWVIVASVVLNDIASDPWKVIAYAVGFSLGNYLGSVLEEKIGLGTMKVDIIIQEDKAKKVIDELRDRGFGVTVLDGEGRNYRRKVLLVILKRKQAPKFVRMVHEIVDDAFITMSDIKPVYGGFGSIRK